MIEAAIWPAGRRKNRWPGGRPEQIFGRRKISWPAEWPAGENFQAGGRSEEVLAGVLAGKYVNF